MIKKNTLLAIMAITVCTTLSAQNLNMINGNASDYGFNFNSSTGVVSNLFFTFGEDDGWEITDQFVVSWGVQSDVNDFGTYVEIDRVYFTQGIDGYSTFVINSWASKNLNDNWDVEDGDYLLVGIVDTDNDISETNEDATDNGMFLAASASETISYTAGGSTGASEEGAVAALDVYPNPVQDIAQISFSLDELSDIKIEIFDISGRLVSTNNFEAMKVGKHIVQISTANVKPGVYFTQISTGKGVLTKQIVKK